MDQKATPTDGGGAQMHTLAAEGFCAGWTKDDILVCAPLRAGLYVRREGNGVSFPCGSRHRSEGIELAKEWEILTTQPGKRAFELRLRNPWVGENGEHGQKWILASCDQEFEADGTTIKTIMGCM